MILSKEAMTIDVILEASNITQERDAFDASKPGDGSTNIPTTGDDNSRKP